MKPYLLPVLDSGYVYLFSSSPDGEKTKHILNQYYSNVFKPSILSIPRVVVSIKCPIAVLLTMTRFHLVVDLSAPRNSAFNPSIEHIKSGKMENDKDISESIKNTNEALMLNQKAYAEDNCDRFVATLTTPIAAYWEGLAYGDLCTWVEFVESKSAPKIVSIYQGAIKNILIAEYGNIYELGRGCIR